MANSVKQRVEQFLKLSIKCGAILEDFSKMELDEIQTLLELPQSAFDDDIEPLVIEALASTGMVLSHRLLRVRPWSTQSRLPEGRVPHIEELTAHGVAFKILLEMSSGAKHALSETSLTTWDGLSPEQIDEQIDELLKLVGESNSLWKYLWSWEVDETAMSRLLKFMKQERVLVAVWAKVLIQSDSLEPRLRMVRDAIAAADKPHNMSAIARETLFGKKKDEVTDQEEGQMKSILSSLRRIKRARRRVASQR